MCLHNVRHFAPLCHLTMSSDFRINCKKSKNINNKQIKKVCYNVHVYAQNLKAKSTTVFWFKSIMCINQQYIVYCITLNYVEKKGRKKQQNNKSSKMFWFRQVLHSTCITFVTKNWCSISMIKYNQKYVLQMCNIYSIFFYCIC